MAKLVGGFVIVVCVETRRLVPNLDVCIPRVRVANASPSIGIPHADRSDVSRESGRVSRKAACQSQRLRLVCERRIRLRWHPGPLRGLYAQLVGTRQAKNARATPSMGCWQTSAAGHARPNGSVPPPFTAMSNIGKRSSALPDPSRPRQPACQRQKGIETRVPERRSA